jgi:exodeoxyribonuclease-3
MYRIYIIKIEISYTFRRKPDYRMRILSFNVNGIRAIMGKSKNGAKDGTVANNCLTTLIAEQHPDILCLQEIKTQSNDDLDFLPFPFRFVSCATNRKGYSGVALCSTTEPEWVSYGFDRYSEDEIGLYLEEEYHLEGRMITAKFPSCLVITVYVPNAKPELARIEERVRWEERVRAYLQVMQGEFPAMPIVLCGDLNVCPAAMDIHQPRQKKGTPGVSAEERGEFQKLCEEAGMVDSFRSLHPQEVKYSYWSNFANSRAKNKGWRIDMAMVSSHSVDRIRRADCLIDYHGSDHCPILCELDL